MTIGSIRIKWRWLFFGLLALMLLVRLQPVYLYPLEWDEVNELALAKLPSWVEIIRVNAIREYHPPAFPMLLHVWIGFFGDSDFWVRTFTWLWGGLGLLATYLLALEISKSRRIGLVTMALTLFSPFLWHYAAITTFYAMYYALVLFSWYFLLRLQPPDKAHPVPNKPFNQAAWWALAYFLFTLTAMYLHAAGPVFWIFQALYVTGLYVDSPNKRAFTLLGALGGLLLLAYIPNIWTVLQPWHISNRLVPQGYDIIPLWQFLWGPVNLLWLGYDIRDMHEWPAFLPTTGFALLTIGLLWLGFQTVTQKYRDKRWLLLCIGILPLVLMFAVSHISGKALFQFRALLFSLFTLHFVMAAFVRFRFKTPVMVAVITALMLLQVMNPYKRPYWPDTGNILARNVRAGFQPGDGVVFYPGWMSLVFMRYFDPDTFGLSPHERDFNPYRENHLNTAHRIDERYFIVSGEETLRRPDVQAAFQAFEERHARIWLVAENNKTLWNLLGCQRTYMVLLPDGSFAPVRCQKPR